MGQKGANDNQWFCLRLIRKLACLLLLFMPVSSKAQFNTNQLMQTGRIALQ